jgi:hypothetical protein
MTTSGPPAPRVLVIDDDHDIAVLVREGWREDVLTDPAAETVRQAVVVERFWRSAPAAGTPSWPPLEETGPVG